MPARSWRSAAPGSIDGFDNAALSVLAPDIQDALGVSDAVMGAIGGASGVLFVLGAIPVGTPRRPVPRKLVAAVSMSVWSRHRARTGLVQNAFWLFLARLGTGLGQSTRCR